MLCRSAAPAHFCLVVEGFVDLELELACLDKFTLCLDSCARPDLVGSPGWLVAWLGAGCLAATYRTAAAAAGMVKSAPSMSTTAASSWSV